MELEELRQRLLLRSKSTDIPPLAQPVQFSEAALGQAASKFQWESTVSPVEMAARLGIKTGQTAPSTVASQNGNGGQVESAPAQNAAPTTSQTLKPPTEPVALAGEPAAILTTKVGQLSEPTEAFRAHLANLGQQLEPIDAATEAAEQALRRIAGLFEHLSSLSHSFQSVQAFADQVKTLSASFEPMQGLNTQIDLVMQALYTNVKEAGVTLAPVKNFQSKVRRLMIALDSIEKLEGQLSVLAEAFRPGSEKPTTAPDAPRAEKSTQVAQAA